MAAETAEEKVARLERLREAQQERLAAETAEQRDARLERLREAQQKRLAAETAERHLKDLVSPSRSSYPYKCAKLPMAYTSPDLCKHEVN